MRVLYRINFASYGDVKESQTLLENLHISAHNFSLFEDECSVLIRKHLETRFIADESVEILQMLSHLCVLLSEAEFKRFHRK